MRLLKAVVAAVLLFTHWSPGWAQCTRPNGRQASYSSVRLVLNNPDGMPAAVQQGISGAIAAWNATACNDGDDFPVLSTAGAADETIQVFFDPGISQARDDNNNSVCGQIDHGGMTDGSNATITLFGTIRLASGDSHDCYTNSDIAADSVAHELGHYLGLDDSGCSGYIMSNRLGSVVNGQFTWDTSRQVQSAECALADSTNMTNAEYNTETGAGNDPFCDAYCWTSCINNSCPPRPPGQGCPILMDIEGDGIRLTGLNDPVWFDIDADGIPDLMAWTNRGEGLLALDRNGNGSIDSGGELFGNYTRLADGSRAMNGYVALAEFDSWAFGGNGDGQIDSADAAFGWLKIWTDRDHDGISQAEELKSINELGVRRIDLTYRRSNRRDHYGNELRFLGRAWKEGPFGSVHPILTWDVFFVVAP
jgi:hypothetical protein